MMTISTGKNALRTISPHRANPIAANPCLTNRSWGCRFLGSITLVLIVASCGCAPWNSPLALRPIPVEPQNRKVDPSRVTHVAPPERASIDSRTLGTGLKTNPIDATNSNPNSREFRLAAWPNAQSWDEIYAQINAADERTSEVEAPSVRNWNQPLRPLRRAVRVEPEDPWVQLRKGLEVETANQTTVTSADSPVPNATDTIANHDVGSMGQGAQPDEAQPHLPEASPSTIASQPLQQEPQSDLQAQTGSTTLASLEKDDDADLRPLAQTSATAIVADQDDEEFKLEIDTLAPEPIAGDTPEKVTVPPRSQIAEAMQPAGAVPDAPDTAHRDQTRIAQAIGWMDCDVPFPARGALNAFWLCQAYSVTSPDAENDFQNAVLDRGGRDGNGMIDTASLSGQHDPWVRPAAHSSPGDLGPHAEKAQDLLQRINHELPDDRLSPTRRRALQLSQQVLTDYLSQSSAAFQRSNEEWQSQLRTIAELVRPPQNESGFDLEREVNVVSALHGKPAGLQVRNAHFCFEVNGFGQYRGWDENVFEPGQTVLLYCELYQQTAEKTFRDGLECHVTRLKNSLVVCDAERRIVQQIDYPTVEDVARSQRRDFYLHVPVTIGQLPPGSYLVYLTVSDLVGNRTTTTDPPIRFAIPAR